MVVTATADGETWAVLATTLRVAGAAGLFAAPLGISLGHLLARRDFRCKSLVETLVAMPLVLPPTAIGYVLLTLFSRLGPLGADTLGFDLDVLLTWRAAVLASTVVAVPLVARAARTAIEGVEPRLELMARSLGLSRVQTFRVITLPLARRGLMAAIALGFARALGEFGATVIVAGNIPGRTQTLALAIFNEIQLGHTGAALRLVAITVALAFVAMWSIERLTQPQRARVSPRHARPESPPK